MWRWSNVSWPNSDLAYEKISCVSALTEGVWWRRLAKLWQLSSSCATHIMCNLLSWTYCTKAEPLKLLLQLMRSDVTKKHRTVRTGAKYRSWVLVKCVWCGAYYWFRLRKATGNGFHAFLLACCYMCCLFSLRYRCIWGQCSRCGVSWHPMRSWNPISHAHFASGFYPHFAESQYPNSYAVRHGYAYSKSKKKIKPKDSVWLCQQFIKRSINHG